MLYASSILVYEYEDWEFQDLINGYGQHYLYLETLSFVYDCIWVSTAQWKEVGLQALPPGLMVVEEIISSEDEKMLLESINWTEDTDNQNGKQNF